jgi:F420-non-reducing hydrogenase iron-sulfur subunit
MVQLKVSDSQPKFAVKLNDESCSKCAICYSACPFEAIKKEPETGKLLLEIEKCQVCALCYSSCPAKAIDIVYYDMNSLTRYLEDAKDEYKSDSLVITCKGSPPDFEDVEKLFGISEFITLSVPCVGRIPAEVVLKAISTMGIKAIYILACDEDYCRFERGSLIARLRVRAVNALLEQLGYGKEVIRFKQRSLKVKADRNKCISCGNCVFYCPYSAARLEHGAATFDLGLCRGCGLCVTLCPALALDLEHWEEDRISTLISKLSKEKARPNILVMRCQWAVFPELSEESDCNVHIIDMPCAARVDPLHIMEAFWQGIDGVLIAACHEEDCRSKRGSKEARRLITALKKTLSQIGFEERLHFCSVAPRYPESFHEELRRFKERIESTCSQEVRQ